MLRERPTLMVWVVSDASGGSQFLTDTQLAPLLRRASERGHAQFQKSRAHFGDQAEPEYQIIDIGAARDMGVVPIGARR